MTTIKLRTGVWYNDHAIELDFPDHWKVHAHYPNTPAELDEAAIRDAMANPIGEPALVELAKGKQRPVIVVDDLARPTPAFKIMPYVLEALHQAGIKGEQIRILIATGTHGHQDPEALRSKLGDQAVDTCNIIVHSDTNKKELANLGKTSYNSPVWINRNVVDTDLLIGIGGVYPQHTVGFGGGSKLCLGILGKKTITHLHFKHDGVAGTYNIDNDFRRELDEIARMVGLRTMFTIHTNADLELVGLKCGDHFKYYRDAARFSRERYDAPYPSEADVVIANAYPSDVSYTFMRKAMKVIRCAPDAATKVAIASNYEGLGAHGLFQQGLGEKIRVYKALYHRISVMEPRVIFQKIMKNLFGIKPKEQSVEVAEESAMAPPKENLVLFRPKGPTTPIPGIEGVTILQEWDAVIQRIKDDQGEEKPLNIQFYSCASLQCIEDKAN